MKLVYGISRWTNTSRSGARHIDAGNRKPLCGGRGRKVLSWEDDTGEPTCQYCIRIYEKMKFGNSSFSLFPEGTRARILRREM